MTIRILILSFSLLFGNILCAQYTLNGNASQTNCNCYTLTNDDFWQGGSFWNNNKIDLTNSFDFKFSVFLGCNDVEGADGIAFVLQPISTSVGSQGGGIGYAGLSPALGVTIDTWQNGSPSTPEPDGDPAFDHIAIQLNGDLNHKDSVAPFPINNIAGPVAALVDNDNIEDCSWHVLRIKWDANTKIFSAYMDAKLRVSIARDLVADVFYGDPLVYWGFTGGTGGSKNLQQVCLALRPLFQVFPLDKRCIGDALTFYDSTISFAPVEKMYWDFGDGSPIDSIHVNPVHAYTAAGNYSVVQRVIGSDGCTETNTQQLTIGSAPVAQFGFNNACVLDSVVKFKSESSATFGTINRWYWDLGDGTKSSLESFSKTYATPGLKKVNLVVSSVEGCVSDTIHHIVQVYPKPVLDFAATNACINSTVNFTLNEGLGTTVQQWQWLFHDSSSANSRTTAYFYNKAGVFPVKLFGTSPEGCRSDVVIKNVRIYTTHAFAGNDTIVASNQPIRLQGRGGIIYEWSPSTGLSNPYISNPIAVNNTDQRYILKAFTPAGCISYDTVIIKIYDGPEIYVPGAFSPNKDGLNEILKALPVGMMEFKYFKVFNRLGHEVFSTSIPTRGWDGTYNGKDQGIGAYIWVSAAVGFHGNLIYRKGTVMLVR